MAAFLASLGASTGMAGAGGVMGGLGQLIGSSIMGQPGQAPALGQGQQGTQSGQAQYTNPFVTQTQHAAATADPSQTTQPGANMAQQTASNWANNYVMPRQGGTPINTGSASGYVYQ